MSPRRPRGLLAFIDRYRRIFFFTALGWLALLMAGGLIISQLDAREGLHVFGGATWRPGQPTVLRVGLKDLRSGRFSTAPPLTAHLLDAEGQPLAEPQLISDYAGPFVSGPVTLPRDLRGPFTLRLTGEGEHGPLSAEARLTAAPAPLTWPLPLPKAAPEPKTDEGPLRLDIYPADQVLPGDLPTTLVARIIDEDKAPVDTTLAVTLKRPEGSRVAIPSSLQTDRSGLAWLAAWPARPQLEFELAVEHPPLPPGAQGPPHRSAATRTLVDTPTQFTASFGDPIRRPGAALAVTARSLHRQGPIFADLYVEGRWIRSSGGQLEDGQAQIPLTLPEALPQDPALAWIQVYNTLYQPGRARGGRWLLITARPLDEAARALAERLKAAGVEAAYVDHLLKLEGFPDAGDEAQRVTRFLLGRLARPEGDPTLIADSARSAQLQVQLLKERWMSRMIVALVISGLIVFMAVAFILWRNGLQVQAGFASVQAEGGEDDEDLDDSLLYSGTRRRIVWGAIYMFGVLAVFIAALVQLLTTIRW